jgi:hypothetical protein
MCFAVHVMQRLTARLVNLPSSHLKAAEVSRLGAQLCTRTTFRYGVLRRQGARPSVRASQLDGQDRRQTWRGKLAAGNRQTEQKKEASDEKTL